MTRSTPPAAFYTLDPWNRPTLHPRWVRLSAVRARLGLAPHALEQFLVEEGFEVHTLTHRGKPLRITERRALLACPGAPGHDTDCTLEEVLRRTHLKGKRQVHAALRGLGLESRYGVLSGEAAARLIRAHFRPETLELRGEVAYTLPDAALLLDLPEGTLIEATVLGALPGAVLEAGGQRRVVVRQGDLERHARSRWGRTVFPWSVSAPAPCPGPGPGPSDPAPAQGGKRALWQMFTAVFLTGLAGAGQAGGLLSRLESGPAPYAELRDASGREWTVPTVPLERSEQLAGTLQHAWRRFQDRLHWHLLQSVNRAVLPLPLGAPPEHLQSLNCLTELAADLSIALQQGLSGRGWLKNTPQTAQLSVPPGSARYLPAGLKYALADDGVRLAPSAVPQVQREEYCPDVPTELFPDNADFYSGLGVYVPNVETCLGGACVRGPNFPQPFLLRRDTLKKRLLEACDAGVKTYWKDYQRSVLTTLSKAMPRALSWDGFSNWQGTTSGVVLAPVAGRVSHQAALRTLAGQVRDPLLRPYLEQFGKTPEGGFVRPARPVQDLPGLAPLEEVKRWLLGGTAREMEASGYATVFQTWRSLDTVTDPRPLVYWASSTRCDLTLAGPVCRTPAVPVDLPDLRVSGAGCQARGDRGAGSTTFTLPRFHFRWVSVPEGHPIPGVRGTPRGGPW